MRCWPKSLPIGAVQTSRLNELVLVVSGSNCEALLGRPSVAAPRSADQPPGEPINAIGPELPPSTARRFSALRAQRIPIGTQDLRVRSSL
jgi:hypothetical protein